MFSTQNMRSARPVLAGIGDKGLMSVAVFSTKVLDEQGPFCHEGYKTDVTPHKGKLAQRQDGK